LKDELDSIIKGCQRKKYRYQKKLYDKYASLLYAICFRYFKNADDANDALQEGFIKIYDKIEAYRGDGSFEGWIKRVQVNICLMQLRKNKKTYALTEEVIDESYAEGEEEDSFYSMDPQILFTMIKGLSDGYRTVFNMYVLDGYTHKEISEYLSISEGTSKSQLSRAKKILKEQVLSKLNEGAR
jgi:RNA polymerase sigma factor (sigma-70 family)